MIHTHTGRQKTHMLMDRWSHRADTQTYRLTHRDKAGVGEGIWHQGYSVKNPHRGSMLPGIVTEQLRSLLNFGFPWHVVSPIFY